MLANTGVRRIVYGEFYREARVFDVAAKLGIQMDEVRIPEDAG